MLSNHAMPIKRKINGLLCANMETVYINVTQTFDITQQSSIRCYISSAKIQRERFAKSLREHFKLATN